MTRRNKRKKIRCNYGFSEQELKRLRKLYVKKSEDKDISKDKKKKSV